MSVGRNDPCPCGSGRKYKHCHGAVPDRVKAGRPRRTGVEIQPSLERAKSLHQRGYLTEAESMYLEVLKRLPRQADAMNMLGILCAQRGDPVLGSDWSARLLSKATTSRPTTSSASPGWRRETCRLPRRRFAKACCCGRTIGRRSTTSVWSCTGKAGTRKQASTCAGRLNLSRNPLRC